LLVEIRVSDGRAIGMAANAGAVGLRGDFRHRLAAVASKHCRKSLNPFIAWSARGDKIEPAASRRV
jgi:hypothetical protein